MRKSIAHKVFTFLSAFSLVIQSLSPFLAIVPPAYSTEPLASKIEFKTDAGAFHFEANTVENSLTSGKISYLLAYKNNTPNATNQIEAAQGITDLTGSNFSKDIDAKTCSSNGVCVNHIVPRGILKLKIDANGWYSAKRFTLSGGTVTVVKEEISGSVDSLTGDEELWLQTGQEAIALPTPTPTVAPTAIPTPTVVEHGQILTGISTQVTPTVTVIPLSPTPGQVSANGDEVVQASVVSTQAYVDPTIWTNQADYAPTEKVVVSGRGFTPGYIYTIVISSNDPPAVTHTGSVTALTDGTFTYEYQLDGNYRPNYLVQVKDLSGAVVTSVTFTDGLAVGSPCTHDSECNTGLSCIGQGNNKTCQTTVTTNTSSWPGCGFQCTANDTTVTKLELVDGSNIPLTTCTPGLPVTATIRATFHTTSGADRKAVVLLGDIYQGATNVHHFQTGSVDGQCVTDTLPAQSDTSINLYSFSWTCGQQVTIQNLTLSWDTGSSTCAGFFSDPSCGNRTTKCYSGQSFTVSSPLVANFTAPNVCVGNATNFTDTTSGGVTPYVYSWTFGDAGTSTSQNPSHTYASPNAYNVTLNVTDSKSPANTDSQTNTVNVWAKPAVGFSASSQVCPSNAITFTNNSTTGSSNGSAISSYLWDFGDGTTSTSTSPSHTYSTTGNYTVTLTANDGHTCSNSVQHSVTIAPCGGTLTVNKVLAPSNDPGKFNLKIGSTTYATNVGDGGSTGAQTVSSGTISFGEEAGTGTNLSDYTTTYSAGCANGQVAINPGDNTTCTITNTRKTGSLNVHKLVDTAGGGTYDVNTDAGANTLGFRWGFDSVAGNNTISFGSSQTKNTGPYSVYENSVTDYHFVGWYDNSGTGSCEHPDGRTLPASVTLNNTATTEITLCNAHNIGNLYVKKIVNPHDSSMWTFNIAGPRTVSFDMGDGASYGLNPFPTGNYTISEAGYTGTKTSDYTSHYECTNAQGAVTSGDGTSVDLTLHTGENLSCIFTNTAVLPKLTLVKSLTKDNGGTASATDWTLQAVGPETISGVTGAAAVTNKAVSVGTYTLSESGGPTGYSASTFSCVKNNGSAVVSNSITLALSDTATCTITNDDEQSSLLVKKHVVNTGAGSSVASDFSLSVTGTNVSQSSVLGSETGTTVTLDAGLYGVSEGTYAHYTPSYSTDCNGSMSPGNSKTCTVTNTYQPYCGDGYTDTNETCDDGANNGSYGYCNATCTGPAAYCGDNVKNGNEQCDGTDGVPSSDFYCTNKCTLDLVHPKVDICHATDSQHNPYITNQPDKTGDVGGHDGHNGPIWYPGINVSWGDIIPPFDYLDNATVQHYDGKNWTTDGQAIYNNSCNIPTGTMIVKKVMVGGTDTFTFTGDVAGTISTNNGTISVSSVFPGTYVATESAKTNWDLTDITCDDGKSSVASSGDLTIQTATFNVDQGETVTCTFTNTKRGSITVHKLVDTDGNGTFETDDTGANTLGFRWNIDGGSNQVMGATDSNVLPGQRSVNENTVTGYHFVAWYPTGALDNEERPYSCANPQSTTLPISINVGSGGTSDFTLCNARDTGTLKVNKLQDIEGKNTYDTLNSTDFTWGTVFGTTNYGMGMSQKLTTGKYNVYENTVTGYDFVGWFYGNPTESDFSCTNLPEGIAYTSLPTNIEVSKNGTTEITLCNQSKPPVLTLSKFNTTWPNDTTAGNDVVYTLVLNVSQNTAHGVVVTDLPPAGFKYKAGSWKAYKNGVLFSIPEPVYHSPGKWQVGDVASGDKIELVYTATIDGDQKPGLYKDLAWAVGCQNTESCSISSPDALLATAVSSGTTDPGTLGVDTFVGSKVNLAKSDVESVSTSVEKKVTGEVLGASTSLPATGTPNIWIIISGLFTMLGLILVGAGLYKKKAFAFASKVATFILVLSVFLSVAGGVHAVTNLQIRLAQPKSPTRLNDFTLNYVALDLLGQNITVKCYMKKPSQGYVQIGSDIAVLAGGNSGLCPLTSSMIDTNGTYQFYATAATASDTTTSETISVDYNTSGPGTPSSYSKERISMCEYKISFKTADDGKTVKVEIYRSENTSFTADSGTRVKTMAIGPNTNGTFNDIVGDCGKTYYYVLRAFDSSENGSGLVGDSVTVTTTSTTTTTTSGTTGGGAIPVSNVTLPAGETAGQVQGTSESSSSVQSSAGSSTATEVLGAQTQVKKNPVSDALKWVATHKKISLGVIILISIVFFALSKYAKKKDDQPTEPQNPTV